MEKKKIIIIVVAVLLLAIVGVAVWYFFKEEKETDNKGTDKETEKTTDPKKAGLNWGEVVQIAGNTASQVGEAMNN